LFKYLLVGGGGGGAKNFQGGTCLLLPALMQI